MPTVRSRAHLSSYTSQHVLPHVLECCQVSHMIDGVNPVAETQNARVAYLTVFTVVSLAVLSVAQVYYLRRFFQVSTHS
jgi:hypothetical protein